MKDRLSRRDLLALAATSGAVLALPRWARAAEAAPAKKKLLILGGTRFLGVALVEAALAKGWELTLFNRGKSNPGLFKERPLEEIHGDRNVAEDVKKLAGRKWDAVIDTSGYFPRQVRSATEVLAGNVGQYVFISSISVYATPMKAGMDETAAVMRLAGRDGRRRDQGHRRGELRRAEAPLRGGRREGDAGQGAQHPARLHRRGPRRERPLHLLAGPRPEGGRGPRPGEPDGPDPVHRRPRPRRLDDPDGRRRGRTASSTRPGPKEKLSMGAFLEACRKETGSKATFTWAPEAKLKELGLTPEADFPIWVSTKGEEAGIGDVSIARALKAGLTFRPLGETIRSTLAFWDSLPEERRAKMRAGLAPEKEAADARRAQGEGPGGRTGGGAEEVTGRTGGPGGCRAVAVLLAIAALLGPPLRGGGALGRRGREGRRTDLRRVRVPDRRDPRGARHAGTPLRDGGVPEGRRLGRLRGPEGRASPARRPSRLPPAVHARPGRSARAPPSRSFPPRARRTESPPRRRS